MNVSASGKGSGKESPAYRFSEPVIKDTVESSWKKNKAGVINQMNDIMKTFGVDKALRPQAGEMVDLVAKSGNVLKRGVLNNIQLGKDTGKSVIEGNPFVGNNNILETWKKAGAKGRRKIVMDYSKGHAAQQAEVQQKQRKEWIKPQDGVDMQA